MATSAGRCHFGVFRPVCESGAIMHPAARRTQRRMVSTAEAECQANRGKLRREMRAVRTAMAEQSRRRLRAHDEPRSIVRRGLALTSILAAAAVLLAACSGGRAAYEVSVSFNGRYTDAAGAAVEDAIHDYDAKANVILQTSFPPVAHATVHTNATAFCAAFRPRLMSRTDIARIDCQRSPSQPVTVHRTPETTNQPPDRA